MLNFNCVSYINHLEYMQWGEKRERKQWEIKTNVSTHSVKYHHVNVGIMSLLLMDDSR